jgi:ABC-type branched-subunit amino acid transport system ATPase component
MRTQGTIEEHSAVADSASCRANVLLEAHGISKSFGGIRVLRDVNFQLFKGDVVLLRGENGSGKTTLLNVLTGNLEPDSGELVLLADGTEERFKFPRHWWQELNPLDHFTPERVALEQIGRAWQDLRLFPGLSVVDNVMVASTNQLGENPARVLFQPRKIRKQESDLRRKTMGLLVSLGLEGLDQRTPNQISLGQAKRAAIARALRADAQVLFLDEPLSGLDETGVEQILGFLEFLIRTQHLTLVIIEHRFQIPRLLGLATRIWTMRDGKLESEDMAAAEDVQSDSFMATLERQSEQTHARECHKLPGSADLTVFRSPWGSTAEPVVSVSDWRIKRGSRVVVGSMSSGLNFTLIAGDVAVLRAPNGWGKTTLADSLLGLLPHWLGSLVLRGRHIEKMPVWERSLLGITLVQSRNLFFPSLSVHDALKLSRIGEAIPLAPDLMNRNVDQLSGGERQRLMLATALEKQNNSLLILDEPFNSLDTAGIIDLQKKLLAFPDAAVLVLMPGITF